jgi:methionyl-tRNA synthetase
MQIQQPWSKLKDDRREDGIQDLQFLLWVVKQLAVLSAPILVEGFAKMQRIFGNPTIDLLDSSLCSE